MDKNITNRLNNARRTTRTTSLSAKASALLAQISILENGHRRALLDLDLVVEAGSEFLSPRDFVGRRPEAATGSGETVSAMHLAAEKLRVDLQSRRAQVGALEVEVAAAELPEGRLHRILPKLSAWLRGSVEGNITPARGTLPLEVVLRSIRETKDPGHRTLLILSARAFKMANGLEKLLAVERGVMERPADPLSDSPALPPLVFTPEQRAAATEAFDAKFAPDIARLEVEMAAAAATSMVGVADVPHLSKTLDSLRLAVAGRVPPAYEYSNTAPVAVAVAAAVERADTALFWSSAVEAGAAATSVEDAPAAAVAAAPASVAVAVPVAVATVVAATLVLPAAPLTPLLPAAPTTVPVAAAVSGSIAVNELLAT